FRPRPPACTCLRAAPTGARLSDAGRSGAVAKDNDAPPARPEPCPVLAELILRSGLLDGSGVPAQMVIAGSLGHQSMIGKDGQDEWTTLTVVQMTPAAAIMPRPAVVLTSRRSPNPSSWRRTWRSAVRKAATRSGAIHRAPLRVAALRVVSALGRPIAARRL